MSGWTVDLQRADDSKTPDVALSRNRLRRRRIWDLQGKGELVSEAATSDTTYSIKYTKIRKLRLLK
jgi:hypothetical protein